MKDRVIQILLSVIFTIIGIITALSFSMEQPHYVGETYAIIFVPLFNALWLIPYSIFFYRKSEIRNFRLSIFIYFIFITPFIVFKLYNTQFDSMHWKQELNTNKSYDKYPAHINGKMVTDIIKSKVLLGLTIESIEHQIGKNYYISTFNQDTVFCYFYSNKNIFDGCDKLIITMKNGYCIKADFGGCD